MSIRRVKTRLLAGVLAAVAAVSSAVVAGTSPAAADSALVYVHSTSMNKNIPVKILKAAGGGPAPTLYLLDGLRAPDDNNGWLINTDVVKFFANKHVNVVIPFGGGGTFYSDWERDDPKLGHVRWETFLTRELPAYMRGQGSDGVHNAIAGLSMSGTSALNLAAHNPNFYQGVASYSGYPTASTPGFAQGIQVSVAQMGGNPLNMWGVWPSPSWFRNDPSLNAGALRGKRVYLSAGDGRSVDPTVNPLSGNFNPMWFTQMVPLEVASGISTDLFIPIAQANGAILTTHTNEDGYHWWSYWQARLHESWRTTLGPALGVR
ncbi:hypothetical protein GCM10027169_30980 [Gordonia jinhuaensis]|uniref:Trehalose O-mycolyltransferase n=1 Tax=Gordonia jinhuaensis TaxID=1517702 RepID=A0A916WWA8_9ACTN|nr:alpha/beta hydrolase family protein [Gordonia jinhuaensis]GGB35055.1 hypothetical protein GCM10011489_23850 [Gordonia jinhuaensis]